MQRLRRQDSPPDRGPMHFVRRLKARQKAIFTILSERFFGCFVHWTGDRTLPCEADDDTCPGHRRLLPVKWKGYLWVLNHTARQSEFLEFTRVGALELLGQLPQDCSLRSIRLQVSRGNADNARAHVEVLHAVNTPEMLPPDKNPQETLEELWALNGRPKVQLHKESDIAAAS